MPIPRHCLAAAGLAAALAGLCAPAAFAARLGVAITNEQQADGFYLTPLVGIIHDGTFDTFDNGAAVTQGVQEIAEDGAASTFIAENPVQNISVIGNPAGFPGAPVIDPGETASAEITVADPATDRYFSFLSMLIPSNDTFLGNDDPTAYQLFGALGGFLGPITIQVFGSDLWESGTEVDGGQGAAFSAIGGSRTDQNGVVQAALAAGTLDAFPGTQTAAGTTIGGVPGAGTLIATITVAAVPIPPALPLLGAGLAGLALLRRRRPAGQSLAA